MGIVVWITGLPGSGKSTAADALKKIRKDFTILRMDDFRKVVTPEPSYSDQEREIVYRSLVYLASELARAGKDVIIDATGNLRRWRELARGLIVNFVEVYLECAMEECMKRESSRENTRGAPRDIYGKGKKGWPVPGMNAPYEAPLAPEITIGEGTSAYEAAAMIDIFLTTHYYPELREQ